MELERNQLRLSSYRHVLGWTYLRSGEIDRAEAEFESALTLNPGLDGARQGLEAIAVARRSLP